VGQGKGPDPGLSDPSDSILVRWLGFCFWFGGVRVGKEIVHLATTYWAPLPGHSNNSIPQVGKLRAPKTKNRRKANKRLSLSLLANLHVQASLVVFLIFPIFFACV